MDLTTITAAISGLKTSIDIAKSAIDSRDITKLAEAKSSMLERVIEIQSTCFELQQINQELFQKLNQAEARCIEMQRNMDITTALRREIDENFEVHVGTGGSTFLRSKQQNENGGRSLLCATCAADGKKVFLNRATAGVFYVCPTHGTIRL